MDNWNNEQNQDMSVSGQFSGNPYQNQNQNTYDQNVYPRQNMAGSYDQNQGAYQQPLSGYGQPYANYNQPSYSGPGYVPPEMEEPVGVGEWTGLLAIAAFVPCIGLILVLVWAFGGADKKSKSNFCKAYLIIALIKLALYLLLCIIWGASLASVIDSF